MTERDQLKHQIVGVSIEVGYHLKDLVTNSMLMLLNGGEQMGFGYGN